MSDVEIVLRPSHELAVASDRFQSFLAHYGLPIENTIATTDERRVVGDNLPAFLASLSADEKRDARYLSKFVGATAIGLFDAALNCVWNEVVLNLRRKVIVYGVDLFFDAAVGGAARAAYKDADDLPGLKDRVLLETCRKLELISDIVYRKLEHILTMRNEVAASHPNVESIGGFELLGWLQTCVRDVLQDQPSESAIRIKSLIANLRASPDLLDAATVARFAAESSNLSLPHVQNLVLTLFGMHSSPSTGSILRANIIKIAPHVWEHAPESIKYRVGLVTDGYRTNLEKERLDHAIAFLGAVDGHRYETLPARTVALSSLADRLLETHQGHNNFYNEPPVMREILQFVKTAEDIPAEVKAKLTAVVVRCRIGRGVWYREGVSPGGLPLYDRYLHLLDEEGVVHALLALFEPMVNHKLQNQTCQPHLAAVLGILATRVSSERLRDVIAFLEKDVTRAWRAGSDRAFRELSAPYIVFR